MKILLVDDDREEREAMTALLETDGHRVTTAADGHEALARLVSGQPDVVVTDFEMPGMGGGALIEALRRDHPEVPALLISSHPEASSEGRRLGVRTLAKPVSAEVLLATVDGVVAEGPVGPRSSEPETHRPLTMAPGTVHTQGPARRRSGSGRGFKALTAASVLAAGLALFVLLSPRAPELPDPPTREVVRGGGIELLAPLGPLGEPPQRLQWRAPTEAARHRVALERVGARVFYEETLGHDTTAGAHQVFELPVELVAGFVPMVVYHWRVETFDDQGQVLARSPRGRFRLLIDPLSVESSPEPADPISSDSSPSPETVP